MKVLIADDDPVIRALLSAVLTSLGHDPELVEDGAAAWQRYEILRPPLVLLDIDMPGMNGLDVCRHIRAADPQRETFIVVVTGHDGPDDLPDVLDAGADDYITKPASPDNLRARLRIAERRIAQERARREAEAEVQRSRWLSGIGETTIALQHEINNPLSALLGHAELLLLEYRDRGERNEQVEVIQTQARRIADVVKRLRELRDPRSVTYVGRQRMLDLSDEENGS
jgi:DNA-binding response OmpR family regulator